MQAAFEIIKPGTDWEQVQLLMHDVLIRRLLKLGLFVAGGVQGDEDAVVKAILESGVSAALYPHGVGHLLGLDVHDVGGLPEGKSTNPLLRYLRLRVLLEEGFVVTVEPGSVDRARAVDLSPLTLTRSSSLPPPFPQAVLQ